MGFLIFVAWETYWIFKYPMFNYFSSFYVRSYNIHDQITDDIGGFLHWVTLIFNQLIRCLTTDTHMTKDFKIVYCAKSLSLLDI